MVSLEHDTHSNSVGNQFVALGPGLRPVGSLLNPCDAATGRSRDQCNSSSQANTTSTPSTQSEACSEDISSYYSAPSSSLGSEFADRRSAALSIKSHREEEEVCFIWYH